MDSKERLVEALNYLKAQVPGLGNPAISKALSYNTDSYVADIISGNKKITPLFLKRLKREYSINPEWINNGSGKMILEQDLNSTQRDQVPLIDFSVVAKDLQVIMKAAARIQAALRLQGISELDIDKAFAKAAKGAKRGNASEGHR